MNETPLGDDLHGPPRTLAVVDWALDTLDVAGALAREAGRRGGRLGLLVPARLRGLDWAGDPRSSRPCAERQLADLQRILTARGLAVDAGWIGDPETVPAIREALDAWRADEVVLVGAGRGLAGTRPLSLLRRVRRATGLPVRPLRVPRTVANPGHSRRRPHCEAAVAR